jgi:steroid Delta-isomerase
MTEIPLSTSTPAAVETSWASWRCVGAGDRAGWLALMADDVVIEDPIGVAVTNADGTGVHGKEAVGQFFDANIGPNTLTVTCEETFPSSDPREAAHVLVLRTEFPGGLVATVRGVFTYAVNDAGLLTHLRGYWNGDSITLSDKEAT